MVEEIRARAVKRPAMGQSAVFVIGNAERMVPQASSQEAANAFLKLLEEPPTDTLLFLTSSRPGALLPTIRSRMLEVRVTPPDLDEAVRFLSEYTDMERQEVAAAIRRTEGSIGRVLELSTDGGSDERAEAAGFLACALTGSRAERLRLSASFPPAGARGAFAGMLEALGRTIRDAAAVATGSPDAALDPDVAGRIPGVEDIPPLAFLEASRHVELAKDAAAGNGNPESIAAVLLADLSSVFSATGR
jgi:DNA polymerase-3 subunit delta'